MDFVHIDQTQGHAVEGMAGRVFGGLATLLFHLGPDALNFFLEALLDGVAVQALEFHGLPVQQHGGGAQILGLQQGQFAVSQLE